MARVFYDYLLSVPDLLEQPDRLCIDYVHVVEDPGIDGHYLRYALADEDKSCLISEDDNTYILLGYYDG